MTPKQVAVHAQVLNPQLYKKLCAVFGEVSIAKQGLETLYSDFGNAIVADGERYEVRCPFCYDKKRHLSISYEWGVYDGTFQTCNWGRAICWRRGCLSEADNLKQLRSMVFRIRPGIPYRSIQRYELAAGIRQSEMMGEVTFPGTCIPFLELGEGHTAWLYLENTRKFDPAQLAEEWGIQYCVEVDPRQNMNGAKDRIIVPVDHNGRMVGWQGRVASDGTPRPKYYNLPGPWKNQVLYGYEKAKEFPYVILVEGVTDVWRIGPPACATLGKHLSPTQAQLICNAWPAGPVVVWADDELAWQEAQASYSSLKRLSPDLELVPFTTKDGRDPGDLSTAEAWELIRGLPIINAQIT